MRVILKDVRVAFTHQLYNAEAFQGEGEPRYSCTFLVPKDHHALPLVQEKIKAVATDK